MLDTLAEHVQTKPERDGMWQDVQRQGERIARQIKTIVKKGRAKKEEVWEDVCAENAKIMTFVKCAGTWPFLLLLFFLNHNVVLM
jgi:hypothetical protein